MNPLCTERLSVWVRIHYCRKNERQDLSEDTQIDTMIKQIQVSAFLCQYKKIQSVVCHEDIPPLPDILAEVEGGYIFVGPPPRTP